VTNSELLRDQKPKYFSIPWRLGSIASGTAVLSFAYIILVLKPIGTYGIQLWGTTSNSNIAILERLQSKVLRLIVNAPWHVPNSVIRKDLLIPSVQEEISRFTSLYPVRLHTHPNELIASLTEPPTHKRLR
jgi:hypothetical protein